MKIIIVGNGGTGKSTLGDKLAKELNLPVTHLDRLGFKKNWVREDESDFTKKLNDILGGGSWIIEGWSYQSTMKMRIESAEIIIYISFPIWSCYWNAFKRHISYTFRFNPYDPPRSWIWRKTIRMVKAMHLVHTKYEPQLKEWLEEYKNKKEIYVFKTRKELNKFTEEFIKLNKNM